MEIKVIYEDILRQTVEPVTVFDAELKKQADEMVSLMIGHYGIGLSGNQVGLNKKLIVCGYKPQGEDDDTPAIPFQQLVNPRIVKFSQKKDIMEEGCLSLPGLELPVERSVGITLEAQDLSGKVVTIKTKGLHARVLQHEVDHLNGILFTDRVNNFKKIADYKFARILFCGSDDFSAPILESLVTHGLNVMSVITETAKPSGRGRELAEPLIKKIAQDNKIAVFQPEDKVELTEIIEQIKPDLLILASYGKILPAQALESAVYGCLNVHPSILPKFRGATPIQSTILAGEKTTGVTVMEMAAQVDAGGIVSQEKVSLTGSETSPVLRERLAKLGASQLIKALPIFLSGQAKIIAQKEADVTSTKKLTKEMGEIDWSLPVEQIDRQIRALDPWPGTYTTLGEKRLKIVSAKLNSGKLELETVQLEGKNVANWQDFKRGYAKQLTNEVWFSKIV